MALRILTLQDIVNWKDPDEGKIVIDEQNETITLNFSYPYEIDLDRIKTRADLLHWVAHLCEKNWMNTWRIRKFMEHVSDYRCWHVWQRHPDMKHVGHVAGVYLLHRSTWHIRTKKHEEIIYVGESNDIQKRIGEHAKSGIFFDHVEVIEIAGLAERLTRERSLIEEHRPRLNKLHKPRQKFSLDETESVK